MSVRIRPRVPKYQLTNILNGYIINTRRKRGRVRLIAAVLKTAGPDEGPVSSNLTASANVVKIQQTDFKNVLTTMSKDVIINTC